MSMQVVVDSNGEQDYNWIEDAPEEIVIPEDIT